MEIVYLIDQQCSEKMIVKKKGKPAFQPIVISKEIGMFDSSDVVMELSRDQALGLAAMLTKAALTCDGPKPNCQYPGYVFKMKGFDQPELKELLKGRSP